MPVPLYPQPGGIAIAGTGTDSGDGDQTVTSEDQGAIPPQPGRDAGLLEQVFEGAVVSLPLGPTYQARNTEKNPQGPAPAQVRGSTVADPQVPQARR